MNKNKIKTFARDARNKLRTQVKSKLEYVLSLDSSEIKNKEKQVQQLKDEIKKISQEEVIEKVAYIWFNRLIALRFMDANNYHTLNIGILSAQEGHSLPEILQEAKRGNIDDKLSNIDRQKINDLIDGKISSKDAQSEIYQMLLVAVCNYYHKVMPFMFEKIEDYTELLLPDNLLTEDSIVKDILDNIADEDCQDVEIIGWLYQFYISEKKDLVFEGLKKNVKITPQNIPAATQLFTPHWIVRYMVENSLGRLWLENRPNSRLKEHMKYYIETENTGEILKISSPEEIKIIDPCCGSGHILVYAFDLLTKIYEEEGFDSHEIPYLILEKNLYGIDIDDRAGSLANFALIMKARGYYKRFFKKEVETNVISLENDYNIEKFKEAKNFGSLIEITTEEYEAIKVDEGTLFSEQQKAIKKQALLLSHKYHCVITNPPYMGGSGMNNFLSDFVKKHFPDSKSDLFSCFIERCLSLTDNKCFTSMVTMQTWMFISVYEDLRKKLLNSVSIKTLIQIGFNSFPELNSKYALASAFIIKNCLEKDSKGTYIDLNNVSPSYDKEFLLNEKLVKRDFYNADQLDFKNIPGSPIAYWASQKVKGIFKNNISLYELSISDGQNVTGNNEKFVREFWELNIKSIGIDKKWIFYAKGGGMRKWHGNLESVVDWSEKARKHYKTDKICRIIPEYLWFKIGITWGLITLQPTFRLLPETSTFDKGGSSIFLKKEQNLNFFLAFLNSKLTAFFIKMYNPSLNFQVRDIRNLPIIFPSSETTKQKIDEITQQCIDISKEDWDSRESSWDFTKNDLLKYTNSCLKSAYEKYCDYWKEKFYQLHKNEEELNRLFIEIYELHDELAPDVELKDITILREETKINENNQLEFEKDSVIKQFISYSVGCMLGRYSPDKEGLILANQGETIQDFLEKIPDPSFMLDENNVIPILDEEYFKDDIVNQFKKFLKVTFGEENYEENLKFVEDAIGKDIRNYFLKDFFEDHIRRYKKRPIYWLFSSEKGAFNALIYMHRYKNDTASIVLNDYLREYISKLQSKRESLKQISLSESSPADKKKADKEIGIIDKKLKELDDYEKKLLHIANQRIEIDLDDGVKVNYSKFKDVLYKIKGLEKEE